MYLENQMEDKAVFYYKPLFELLRERSGSGPNLGCFSQSPYVTSQATGQTDHPSQGNYKESSQDKQIFTSWGQKTYIWEENKRQRREERGEVSQQVGNPGDLCIHIQMLKIGTAAGPYF